MATLQQPKKLNMSVIIYDMKFDIVDIIQETQTQFQYQNIKPVYIPTKQYIKILAKTANVNYSQLEYLMNYNLNSRLASNIKKDIYIGSLKISGCFIIDYTFNNNYIDVTFSADYISGDLNQAYLQFQRKEKLEKIKEICQK